MSTLKDQLDERLACTRGWSKPKLGNGALSRSWRKLIAGTEPEIHVLVWAEQDKFVVKVLTGTAEHTARTYSLDYAVKVAERWTEGMSMVGQLA